MRFSRLLARIFMVPLGLFLAIITSCLFLAFALMSIDPSSNIEPEIQSVFTVFSGIILAIFLGPQIWVISLGFLLLCELFSWRSLYIYLAWGAVLSLFAFHTPKEAQDSMAIALDVRALAAALVGAFTYWIVAGRGAGFVKRTLDNKPTSL